MQSISNNWSYYFSTVAVRNVMKKKVELIYVTMGYICIQLTFHFVGIYSQKNLFQYAK